MSGMGKLCHAGLGVWAMGGWRGVEGTLSTQQLRIDISRTTGAIQIRTYFIGFFERLRHIDCGSGLTGTCGDIAWAWFGDFGMVWGNIALKARRISREALDVAGNG